MFVYLLPLALPLISFLILFFSGPFFKKNNTRLLQHFFCKSSVLLMVVNFCMCFIFFILNRTSNFITEIRLFSFFSSHPASINSDFLLLNNWTNLNTTYFFDYSLLVDSLTIIMIFVVLGVSTLVQLFSTEYMINDIYVIRFFSFLNFFSLCMLVLVTAGNFIQMFIGWEGVGIASFLLIGFWFSRTQAVKCALKAVIINRIGDCALLLSFSIIAFVFGNFNYIDFFSKLESGSYIFFLNSNALSKPFLYCLFESFFFYKFIWAFGIGIDSLFLIGLLIIVGAFAKSAQFGLHTWLPDAMEGPTPVSALIHAATMVTAGVFLIIRCGPIFHLYELLSDILLIFGSITALFGASVAASQFDIKKIIAYSTCSQLGYMMAACGVARLDLAIFHLTTHAFFKAGLFLCAGSIIHALSDEQDIRKMGGLVKLLPITYLSVFICSFCLAGIPFLSGFYSKDAIIEATYAFNLISWFSFLVLLFSAFLTSFYSIRFFYYVFWRNYFSGIRAKVFIISETTSSSVAVLFLSGISIFLGFYFIFGNFNQYFVFNSLSILATEASLYPFYFMFWLNPFIDVLTVDFYIKVNAVHQVLPFSVFFILFGVVSMCFFLIFFLKKSYSKQFNQLIFFISDTTNITTIYRHVYTFLSKAWLFDILLAKLARVAFYISKIFIQRQLESGLFEYMNLLFSVRSLNSFQTVFLKKTVTGQLSMYIYDIVLGGVFLCLSVMLSFLFLL